MESQEGSFEVTRQPIRSDSQLTREVLAAQADPSRRLGRYLLLSELGRGSFGAVVRGWDPQLSRQVAIKLLAGMAPRSQVRFQREIQAMAALRHPGIAAVFDSGEHNGQPYLVMDYLAGGSLAERLRAGSFEPGEAARVVRDVAVAVHVAHQQGILHRDIKPDNVLFHVDGNPALVDFGLATLGDDSRITRDGAALGTPSYMSPEQATGKHQEVDQRSDVYALGITLFQLLTNELPFTGGSLGEVTEKILHTPATFSEAQERELDPRLRAVCLKCLAKAREERYPTAEALAADLDRYLHDQPVEALPRSTRGSGPALAAAALALVGLGGAGAFVLRRDADGGEPTPAASSPADTPAEARLTDEELAAYAAEALAALSAQGRALAPWDALEVRVAEAAAVLTRAPYRHELALAHAEQALRRGRLRLAQELAGEVADDATGDLRDRAQWVAAEALEGLGEESRARSVRRELATRDANGLLGLCADAANRLARGETEAALARLEQARGRAPDDLGALCLTARALEPGRPAEALRLWERASEWAPDHAGVALARADCALRVDPQLDLAPALTQVRALCDPAQPPLALTLLEVELDLRAGEDGGAAGRLEPASTLSTWGLLLRGLLRDDPEDWARAGAQGRAQLESLVRRLPPWERLRACQAAEVEDLRACGAELDLRWLAPRLRARLEARVSSVPRAAQEPLRQALHAAARGEPWAAIDGPLRAALVAEPDSGPLALEAVRLAMGRAQFEAAAKGIARARELAPEAQVELTRWEADLHNRAGRLDEARARHRAAAEAGRGAQARIAAAELAFLEGEFQQALERADEALAELPDEPSGLLIRAIALRCLGRPREGFEVATQALGVEGALSSRLLMMRALCYGEALLGKVEPTPDLLRAALEPFDQLRGITDGVSPRLLAANFAFRHAELLPKAGEYLQEARLLQPERAEIHVLLGLHALCDGATRGAVLEHWRRARELEPGLEIPAGYREQFRARFGEEPALD